MWFLPTTNNKVNVIKLCENTELIKHEKTRKKAFNISALWLNLGKKIAIWKWKQTLKVQNWQPPSLSVLPFQVSCDSRLVSCESPNGPSFWLSCHPSALRCRLIFLICNSDCHSFTETTGHRRTSSLRSQDAPYSSIQTDFSWVATPYLCASHIEPPATPWFSSFAHTVPSGGSSFPFPAKLLPNSHSSSTMPSPREVFFPSWLWSSLLCYLGTFERF